MENEIPAGTKVKVNGQDAEVLSHMDGVVHVSMNGEAVSVLPSQVVTGDNAAPAPQNIFTPIVETLEKLSDVPPEVMDQIEKQMAILETVHSIQARMDALEARVTALETPKPIDAAAPAAQLQPNDESTAPVAVAEPAGEGQATSAPEAAANATGE